jgi:hypothetical protein
MNSKQLFHTFVIFPFTYTLLYRTECFTVCITCPVHTTLLNKLRWVVQSWRFVCFECWCLQSFEERNFEICIIVRLTFIELTSWNYSIALHIFFKCVQISGYFVTAGVVRLAMFFVIGHTLINFTFISFTNMYSFSISIFSWCYKLESLHLFTP